MEKRAATRGGIVGACSIVEERLAPRSGVVVASRVVWKC